MHALMHSVPQTLQQATADPRLCQRLLDTPGQVWVSLLWGHCSFLLGPGAHKVLFVPQESVAPVLCKSWRLYGGINDDLLQDGLCHTQVCSTQSPWPYDRTLLTCPSEGETQTLKDMSGSGYVGTPGVHKVLFESSELLWWVWGLILNAISPLPESYWGFSFALERGVSFFDGIQHSPGSDFLTASCNFGVLTEDEYTFFYSAILRVNSSRIERGI